MASRRQNVAAARHSVRLLQRLPFALLGAHTCPTSGSLCRAARERPSLDFSTEDTPSSRPELARLKQEHRDLDTAIEALERMVGGDQLQIQRLKKRKARAEGPDPHARGSAHPRHHRVRLAAFICHACAGIHCPVRPRDRLFRTVVRLAEGSIRSRSSGGSVRPRLRRAGSPMIIASSESALLTGRTPRRPATGSPRTRRRRAVRPNPMRARCSLISVARWTSARSPVSWPCWSLIALEPVEIRRAADRSACRSGRGRRSPARRRGRSPRRLRRPVSGILLRQCLERGRMGAHVGQLRRKALHFGAQRAELGTDVACAELAIGMAAALVWCNPSSVD